jgi:hypothetical protein
LKDGFVGVVNFVFCEHSVEEFLVVALLHPDSDLRVVLNNLLVFGLKQLLSRLGGVLVP